MQERYLPGLDGLRALAVLSVLLFHGQWSWASGGFLGVSLFFTISGFLIASLLVIERDRAGRIDLAGFWTRRARRLLPGAYTTIALTWVASLVVDLGSRAALRRDATASMFYVANWRFIAEGAHYGGLFRAPSPFLQFWSLAIEEQFYLVVAPVFVLAFVLSKRWRSLLVVPLCAVAALYFASLATPARAYFGTFARFPELLAGVVLALAVGRRVFAGGADIRSVRVRSAINLASVIGLAVYAVLVNRARSAETLAEGGWLPAVAVANAAIVAGVSFEWGILRRCFAIRPLPAIGRLSYSLYLVHWPLFLVLTEARLGFGGPALFATRIASSFAVAALMFRFIEAPARRGLRTPRAAVRVLAPAAIVLLVCLVLTSALGGNEAPSFAATRREFETLQRSAPPARVTAALLGDSTALMTGWGLQPWGGETGRLAFGAGVTEFGCGIGRVGQRDYQGGIDDVPSRCDWQRTWTAALDAAPTVDAAVVQVGPWDVTDRRLPGDTHWRAPGDPVYDAYLLNEMRSAMDLLEARGIRVAWLTSPHIELGRLDVPPPREPYPASEPARMDRFNALLREAAAGRRNVTIVDLQRHLASLPGGELDPALRPDGVHFTKDSSRQVANWLGPAIVEALDHDGARASSNRR
jgi:peptidoglycan/LPS O-acetylase OafA/YrhL